MGNTKALMHFNGSYMEEASGVDAPIVISGALSPFGPGVFGQGLHVGSEIPGGIIRAPASHVGEIGSGDYAIEFFLKPLVASPVDIASNGYMYIKFKDALTTGAPVATITVYVGYLDEMRPTVARVTISLQQGSMGPGRTISFDLPLNAQAHVLFQKKIDTIKAYHDGVLKLTMGPSDTYALPLTQLDWSPSENIHLDTTPAHLRPGQLFTIDELRVSGSAMYNEAGFTPPAAPFTIGARIATVGGKVLVDSKNRLIIKEV